MRLGRPGGIARGTSECFKLGQGGDDDAGGELGEERRHASAAGGDPIGVGALDSLGEPLESQAAKVILAWPLL